MTFHIKIHRSYRNVVAICDSELLGKKFEEGKMQLEVRENFFKNLVLGKDEVINLMIAQSDEDATFNIIGDLSINAALEAGIITKENISYISGIPFALVLL